VTAQQRPPRTQIYLTAGAGLEAGALRQALEAGPVACVLVRAGTCGDEALRAAIDGLRPVAHEQEVAFLIENRPRLAHETGCDGVHLTDEAARVATARQAVGAEAIVGVACGASRHAAMVAAEAGADYVEFGGGPAEGRRATPTDPELVSWWQALMTAPCVAFAGDDFGTARDLAAAGADFVAVGPGIWSHPAGPGAAVRELATVLAEARAPPAISPAKDE
jgi:thiamine-phosphate pyrophosphorylase